MKVATLEVLGEYEGPGEEKTAKRLEAELPASWVIFANRRLPGENRDDVDLLVVGRRHVFVLEEKAWGPHVVVDDNLWYVGDSRRANPLNRVGQLARKVAGLLDARVKGYKAVPGKNVSAAVVLSHDHLTVVAGPHHDSSERIYPLSEAAAALIELDKGGNEGFAAARDGVIGFLRGMPTVGTRPKRIGAYVINGRIEVPGTAEGYTAEASDGRSVVLKCYKKAEFEELGDPHVFLERETRALNKLAESARTWAALPFFTDDEYGYFVVPLVPPQEQRNLRVSMQSDDPVRPDGYPEDNTARRVVTDAFDALAEVHDRGLVHRALHPTRIWLGRGLRVLLSDFHLARIVGQESVALWAPDYDASEDYRAPECATNVALADAASDVYSLGLCMAEWLLDRDVTELTREELIAGIKSRWAWADALLEASSPASAERPSAAEVASRLREVPALARSASSPAVTELTEGAVLGDGQFEVSRLLGEGGFAQTWLVYDRYAEQARVLKAFRRKIPDEAKREFQAAEKLKHDRCAKVYAIRTDGSPQYLVSEYVEGQSLATLNPTLSVEQLRGIALDVLEGLGYIHSKGLVHGDVTPSNIIVDASARATLIDFGLSVAQGDDPAGFHPRFSAPEVRAQAGASTATDIYGLGATLIYAMLGRDAVVTDSATVTSVLPPTAAELAMWGTDGAALLRALFQAVAISPAERPASAPTFSELIRTVQAVEPPVGSAEFLVNPTVAALRRLYRASTAGNAGNRGLDDDFAKTTYISTLLDTELEPQILAGALSVVLLTGNPGDGKTSFLTRLGETLLAQGATQRHWDAAGYHLEHHGRAYRAVFDASESHGELSSDALVLAALLPAARDPETAVALIAVNDGRLRQFIDSNEGEFEEVALAIRSQLEGRGTSNRRIAVVDLKRRSLAGLHGQPGLGERTLADLTRPDLWAICTDCRARAACPIIANRELLAGHGAETFASLLRASHLRRVRRATFRDVRSAIAWMLTGDRSCRDIHGVVNDGRDARLLVESRVYDLVFSHNSGDYLINEWAHLDPALVAAPAVDSLRRRSGNGYPSIAAAARALSWGDWGAGADRVNDLQAYRYLNEFLTFLAGDDPEHARRRLLLGISRLMGAFGYRDNGLAIRSGSSGSDYSVLRVVPEDGFTVELAQPPDQFIESVPDTVLLKHEGGPRISLALDTAEIILRAADGEIVNDPGSDSIKQEIGGFVSQLSRTPSAHAHIVDSAGATVTASRVGATILLEERR